MGGKDFGVLFGALVAIGVSVGLMFSIPRPNSIGTPLSEFLAHKAQWAERKPRAYSVRIERQCFCLLSWDVDIRVDASGNDDVAFDHGHYDQAKYSDRLQFPRNIDDVFKMIETAYAEKAYSIDLTFDEVFGFPTRVSVDREFDVIDDEWDLHVYALEPDVG